MLKKLAGDGYVALSPYHGARLTPDGLEEAQRITRKHRLLERFLADILLIPMGRVHAQACELEHSLSDEAEESLCRLLKHPDRCPDDGQVIPACDLPYGDCSHCMNTEEWGEPGSAGKRHRSLIPLSSLRPGDSGRISFIRGDGVYLRGLGARGVKQGATVEAEAGLSPGGLAYFVGGAHLELGKDVAASVFVETREGR